ncbi:hypothetical protein E2C01_062495 [Portunus trituberculatus]|uniref:Uncharacterized protein n=1 Tax=Portunus trituberculatus TaxID=210409 RepID=A0A5B7HG92_PORTR|nr:hypothetical protein [Portunus trituberculatus]
MRSAVRGSDPAREKRWKLKSIASQADEEEEEREKGTPGWGGRECEHHIKQRRGAVYREPKPEPEPWRVRGFRPPEGRNKRHIWSIRALDTRTPYHCFCELPKLFPIPFLRFVFSQK